MTEADSKPKIKFETVVLSENSSLKLTNLIEQASQKKKGIKITRKNFVNWLIERLPENLSSSDMTSLVENFYDEEVFLRHLLKEIKKNKFEGKSISEYEIVLKSKRPSTKKDLDHENADSEIQKSDDLDLSVDPNVQGSDDSLN